MAIGYFEIFLSLLIICLPPTDGVRCYLCDSVSHAEDCAHVGFCGASQKCYTQRLIGDGLNDYFKVGCVDKDVCAQSQFSLFGSFGLGKKRSVANVTRRDSDPMVTCLQCCDGDLCNKALCGAVKTDRRRCFECGDVDRPKDCERIVECGRDEECFTHFGPLHQNGRYTYQMKCMTALACHALTSPNVALQTGCTRCCNNTDYCNFEVCNNWTAQNYQKTNPPTTKSSINQGGATSPTTAPTPPPKPVIKGQSSAMYSLNIHLDCTTSGSALAINWFYNENDPLPSEVTSSGGALDISNLNETRAGKYTCMVVGQNGMISTANVWVTILDTYPIVVSVIKEPPVMNIGQMFTIRCSVLGYPKPKVTWQFIGTDGSSTVPSEVNFSTDQKTLVILHYNNLHHNGKWTCTASNYLGKSQAYVDVP